MDELIVWIGLLVWLYSVLKDKKKKKARKPETEWSLKAEDRKDDEIFAQMQAMIEETNEAQSNQNFKETPKDPTMNRDRPIAKPQAYQVMKPAVSVSDELEDAYGSLAYDSSEGESTYTTNDDDAFDVQETVYTNEITSSIRRGFTSASIVQGIIMSEILQKPSQRGDWNGR